MPDIILKTKNLTKKYGSLAAVDGLNLQLSEGEIFGLLGPNGAGKTTTILMLLGLTEPTSGEAEIYGHNCTRDPISVKRIVGYLPDNVAFYNDMTGRENLRFIGEMNGLKGRQCEERIDMLLERVNMTEAADKRVKEYSRGMRQRLGIADVLMKQPRVIILDEPTLGIDPEGVHELLALIRELAENDRLTVLISSHMLNQVEQICHRVGIFVKGKLAACGDIATLREETQVQENVMLEFNAKPDDVELDALIRSVPGVNEVKKERGLYIIRAGSDVRNGLASTVLEKGYSLLHIRQLGYDLDNIYSNYFVKEAMQ
jgi:ABC-2 type transport system ATP-binding protein